jgi:hypothetical protein
MHSSIKHLDVHRETKSNMKKTFKKILRGFQRELLKTDLERYLEGSQNIADLEYRTKQWHQKQQRANNVFGNRY